ncbi:class I SAM-dependent methyltransferase [Candidatus Dojkabacteria bacterium]|uniref:Class I SAM-dependent methyltransferase n=1 Tax=Candidatus Dojkabacteria bacterium TaxID=2099670 RepID=A0A955L586_9BACT|nr:class I SAM-dependent methyltransferase [Candidatus Dojkabacteria bacterium]
MPHKKWEQFYQDNQRFHLEPHEMLSKVITHLREIEAHKVLDLGCGSGRHLIALAEEGFAVEGIDFSPSAVDLAQNWLQEKGFDYRVSIADLHEEIKSLEKDSFGGILAIDSIHYGSLEEFKSSLREINRLLITGGLLFLVVPTENSIIDRQNIEQIIFTEGQIRDLLADHFDILELRVDSNNDIAILATEKS